MKINIQASIVAKLQAHLQTSHPHNYIFALGHQPREGFVSYLSKWDYQTLACEATPDQMMPSFSSIQHIGIVGSYWVVLGTSSSERQHVSCLKLTLETCTVWLVDNTAYIEVTTQPQTIEVLFSGLKAVSSRFRPLLGKVTDKALGICMRPLKYLEAKSQVSLTSHIALALVPGDWAQLSLCSDGCYLSNYEETREIDWHVSDRLVPTTLLGKWLDNHFTIYDIAVTRGLDLRSRAYLSRLQKVKALLLDLTFCSLASDWSSSDDCGAILTPVCAPYENRETFVYQPVKQLLFSFKIENYTTAGKKLYHLCPGPFSGTEKYPCEPGIPLSREDRQYTEMFPPNSTFGFCWESSGFMPQVYCPDKRLNNFQYTIDSWNYLHDLESLSKSLRTFKKTELEAKVRKMTEEAEFKKLKMLQVNKSVVFYSPIEGEDVLVRTGTIAEGSCFFHAVLHAYSKDYANMERSKRMKFVRRLRASMAGNVDRHSWEEMGGGIIAKVPFQENVHKILSSLYSFFKGTGKAKGRAARRTVKKLVREESQLDLYKLITELLPLQEGFERTILPQAYAKEENAKIKACWIDVKAQTEAYLDNREEMKALPQAKVDYIKNAVEKMLHTVLKEAEEAAYTSYVKGLERVSEGTDSYTIDFISNRFKRDIYFLDGKSRLPYNTCPTKQSIKGRKTIVLLWVGGDHYEVVGRLLSGNRIQREFPPDDILVQRVSTFILQPDEIPNKFPDLEQHLPQSHRTDTEVQAKRSVEMDAVSLSSSSDHYYDSSDDSDFD